MWCICGFYTILGIYLSIYSDNVGYMWYLHYNVGYCISGFYTILDIYLSILIMWGICGIYTKLGIYLFIYCGVYVVSTLY